MLFGYHVLQKGCKSSDAYSEEEGHITPLPPSHTATSHQLQQSQSNFGLLSGTNRDIRTFPGCPHGKNSKAPHINSGSSPMAVFVFFFAGFIQLLVTDTNCHY
jgi:hypothetical protein